MSFDIKGGNCVRCKSILFEEDDVVYCPVCGAPHHRECYNALGHCALESLHGTPEEYSREKEAEASAASEQKAQETYDRRDTVRCEMCGESYDKNLPGCPKCSSPNFNSINGFERFDFLGGVPADYDLGDGVTANEAKMFVAANTHRYIPKFATLNSKNRLSWNWLAFLFPTGWMFSRKMFKAGIISGVFFIISTLLLYPLSEEFVRIGVLDATPETANSVMQSFPQIMTSAVILAFIGSAVNLAVRFISAMFGDYWYKQYAISAIKKIKNSSADIAGDYRKKGGINLIWFLIGIMFIQYVPQILLSFI